MLFKNHVVCNHQKPLNNYNAYTSYAFPLAYELDNENLNGEKNLRQSLLQLAHLYMEKSCISCPPFSLETKPVPIPDANHNTLAPHVLSYEKKNKIPKSYCWKTIIPF